MSVRRLFSTFFGLAALAVPVTLANAQVTEQAAREQALNTVRSQLNIRPDQFLSIQRDENLEQSIAVATVGWRAGSKIIYRVSQTGVEIKGNAFVRHIATDADFRYIIAVNPTDGSTYRISGFADSLAEFSKLMTAARLKVSSPEQAVSVADFYRAVNPDNQSLTPISSLIELKQAAERQCQTSSFEAGEEAFDAWWKRAKSLYAQVPLRQTASPHGGGYLIEWTVLSSAASGNCGGALLRARLEVASDGHVGEITFLSILKGLSH